MPQVVHQIVLPSRSAGKCFVKSASRSIRPPQLFGRCGTSLPYPIGITIVHPGGVATSIAKNARYPSSLSEEEQAKRCKLVNSVLTMPPKLPAGRERNNDRFDRGRRRRTSWL